jgi:hypothetical protein
MEEKRLSVVCSVTVPGTAPFSFLDPEPRSNEIILQLGMFLIIGNMPALEHSISSDYSMTFYRSS